MYKNNTQSVEKFTLGARENVLLASFEIDLHEIAFEFCCLWRESIEVARFCERFHFFEAFSDSLYFAIIRFDLYSFELLIGDSVRGEYS